MSPASARETQRAYAPRSAAGGWGDYVHQAGSVVVPIVVGPAAASVALQPGELADVEYRVSPALHDSVVPAEEIPCRLLDHRPFCYEHLGLDAHIGEHGLGGLGHNGQLEPFGVTADDNFQRLTVLVQDSIAVAVGVAGLSQQIARYVRIVTQRVHAGTRHEGIREQELSEGPGAGRRDQTGDALPVDGVGHRPAHQRVGQGAALEVHPPQDQRGADAGGLGVCPLVGVDRLGAIG